MSAPPRDETWQEVQAKDYHHFLNRPREVSHGLSLQDILTLDASIILVTVTEITERATHLSEIVIKKQGNRFASFSPLSVRITYNWLCGIESAVPRFVQVYFPYQE